MSKVIANIDIENVSTEDVISFLKNILKGLQQDGASFIGMGIQFKVFDITYENEYTKAFFQENEVEETNLFYKNFDLNSFNVTISMTSNFNNPLTDSFLQIADIIGKRISKEFNTRTFVCFDDGEMPFRVYNNGEIIIDQVEVYKNFFENKFWIPKTLE